MTTGTVFNPFELPLKNRWFASLGGALLGLSSLAKHYAARPSANGAGSFLDYTLQALGINVEVESSDLLARIPKTGPVLVVANHPLGGLEGVAIAQLLLKVRPDVQVLTNELLTRIPELSDIFIGVDVLSPKAAYKNVGSMRKAMKHLRNDGMLLIFPAGQVSAINIKSRRIEDRPWDRLVGQLAKKTSAVSVPIYVKGKNSRLFYTLGLIHPRLRTLMLARELSNKQGSRIGLKIGEPVTPTEIQQLTDCESVTHYLRMSTDLLNVDSDTTSALRKAENASIARPTVELLGDIGHLAEFKLTDSKQFEIYCAPFDALGSVMEQIGIARETTFRAAGEGTGNAVDIDQFDPHYMHLLVWDKERQVVAGGYRIGHTDKIVAEHGIDGLYGRTLYRFDQTYLDRIGAAIEVGRSFVHPDYQRHPAVLDLLWRGIGRYVAKHPKYHTLFGAVSISRDHSDMARALISESMLESHRADEKFLEDVEPVTPLKVGGRIWTNEMLGALNKVAVLNKLVGRCDPGKTLPILIRHYLSLNGKFVCFSVNTVFNDSLDGLILVDMRKVPERYLTRYMGKENAKLFMSKWRDTCK
ncbi:MAG: lysophospholipid acyltransferase family protein [Proteobacteria bacterium]|jgi:putative hemolysin|nr:lysophospholipid acyltransferase family protein [Pseudomonadota bacterium]